MSNGEETPEEKVNETKIEDLRKEIKEVRESAKSLPSKWGEIIVAGLIGGIFTFVVMWMTLYTRLNAEVIKLNETKSKSGLAGRIKSASDEIDQVMKKTAESQTRVKESNGTLIKMKKHLDEIKGDVDLLKNNIALLKRHDIERVGKLLEDIEKSPKTTKIFDQLNDLEKRNVTFGPTITIEPKFIENVESNDPKDKGKKDTFFHTFPESGIVVITYEIAKTGKDNKSGNLKAHVTPLGANKYLAATICVSINHTDVDRIVERIQSSTATFAVQARAKMMINLPESGQVGKVLITFHPFVFESPNANTDS